jgi:hypothetical protein
MNVADITAHVTIHGLILRSGPMILALTQNLRPCVPHFRDPQTTHS